MNTAQLHLMTAHLPVVGVPFAAGLIVAGLIGKSETLWRAGCWTLLIAAVFAAFPYFSGPPAYELLSEQYGVAAEPVERHAVVARAASLGLVLLGAVTVSALLRDFQGDRPGRVLRTVILAGAVVVTYALAWSAHLGGSIRHPELVKPPIWAFPTLED
ncbi:MAG: DUF2231 domain-containing protein [Planctomycetaceae bacterium]